MAAWSSCSRTSTCGSTPTNPTPRLLDGQGHDGLFNLWRDPVAEIRFPPGLFDQGLEAAFFHCLLVAIERVGGSSPHLVFLETLPSSSTRCSGPT